MATTKMRSCGALLVAASLIVSPLYAQDPNGTPTEASAERRDNGATSAPGAASSSNTNAKSAPPMSLSMAPDYSYGRSWFPNLIAPYIARHVIEPTLTNSPKLAELIHAGTLDLSLEDAIALALENNLDIAVERYTPWLDQMKLLLAKSGSNGRLAFDPTVTASLSATDSNQPVANPLTSGVGVSSTTSSLTEHTTSGNFGYSQGFAPGTEIQLSFNNSRSTSSSSENVFNPSLSSTLTVSVTQPLLNGFGFLPNKRYIIEGKNTVEVGEWQFKLAVINDVTTTATDYWNLVYARQNVKVEQQTVAVDQKLYDDNKKKLDIGTMAPLDVLTAESQLASDRQQLIVSQTLQLQDETKLLNDITKDPEDSALRDVEVVPTSPIPAADTVGDQSIEDAVREAWQDRPEVHELALNLKNAEVEVKATANALLPSLNFVGEYSTTGLGGVSRSTQSTLTGGATADLSEPIVDQSGNLVTDPTTGAVEYVGVLNETTTTKSIPGGIGDAWDSLIHSRFPTFEVGVTLSLPIRNRAAQANNGTAQLNQREQQVSYSAEKNTIFLAVRNALIAVTQDRAAVLAAAKARELAQQTFDDEQKKYELGSSTSYNVVLRSRDLTQAETTELQNEINLVEAVVNLDQAMGRTLKVHNISIEGPTHATVSKIPAIPGAPVR